MMNTEDLKNISAAYLEVVTEKNKESNEKHKELMKKADEDASNDKSDDGDGMDKVDPKASKKKFADRKDKDVDNDGDVDASDKFLHKRRKAIGKAMAKDDEKEESKTEAKEEEEVCESCGKVHEGDCDPADVKEFKLKKEMKKKKLKADDENPADADSKDADEDEVEEGKRGFIAAAKAAKDAGEKSFVFAGKKYNCEDMKEITKESVKLEATFDTDYFTGYKHAKKAGMKVKTTSKGADGDNVTISHSDPKKLQKYVDNHLGGGKIKESYSSYSFDELVDMSDEDFDNLAERIERKEMDEIVGTIARGIGRMGKKVVNRFSTSGRADAAQKKLGKMKKKAADKDRLSKAKADIAALKNKGKKPAPKPVSAEKEPEKKMKKFNEVREDATKGATKPEGIMDKESPKSKEFAAKHKKEVNDTEEKSHKDAADAGRKGPAGKKRPGDNPKGDKAIVNKPTQKEGVQNGMRQALMQMKGE